MIEVDGQLLAWRPDLTLATLMDQVDPKGEIAVVRLGAKLVSRPNFGATQIPDGAVIYLIPMVAGG
jgi:sulfur carrier protein ThiS